MKKHYAGVLLIIFAFFCTSIISALGKNLLQSTTLGILLCMQNIFALCFCVPFILTSPKCFSTKRIGLHFLRALFGVIAYLCLFIALKYISILDASLLANSSPLFLPLVVLVCFHQKISGFLYLSLIIGFFGVFLVLNPLSDVQFSFHSWMVLVALSGSLFSAMALQCVRNLTKTEPCITINFYYFFLATLITVPLAILEWQAISRPELLKLTCIGFLLALIQFSIARAYKYVTPVILGPFNYSVVIFSGLIQWIFWDVIPGWINLIGVILISLGGTLSILNQKKILLK